MAAAIAPPSSPPPGELSSLQQRLRIKKQLSADYDGESSSTSTAADPPSGLLDLSNRTPRELRVEAAALGIPAGHIEMADDCDDVKGYLILLINQHMDSQARAAAPPTDPRTAAVQVPPYLFSDGEEIIACARFAFQPAQHGDLGFDVGQQIIVTSFGSNDWWQGMLVGGRELGVFPRDRVQLISMSGWMTKKGGIRTNWTKRWFSLKATQMVGTSFGA